MRLLWVLVVICLVAATVGRPLELEGRDPHGAQLDVAPVSRSVVARRAAAQIPDLRLAPFVLAQAPAATPPRVISAPQVKHAANPVDACATNATCARGPPIA
jgi:hypothetical protein